MGNMSAAACKWGGRGIFAACNWRNEGNNFETFIKGCFFLDGKGAVL